METSKSVNSDAGALSGPFLIGQVENFAVGMKVSAQATFDQIHREFHQISRRLRRSSSVCFSGLAAC